MIVGINGWVFFFFKRIFAEVGFVYFRSDDMEQELSYIPSPLKSSKVASTPQSDQVSR